MKNFRIIKGNPWRRIAAFAAAATLLATTAVAIPIPVSTTNGSGADVQFTGWDDVGALDTSANTDQLNIRTTATRHEAVALRFDLSSYPRAEHTNYTINLVNQRANGAVTLLYYAVRNGAVGEDNNGTLVGYTDNNWNESSVVFSTMPGLHWANTATTDQTTNADAIYLGSATMNNVNKGTTVSFTSPELTTFVRTNGDNIVTFLILRTDAGSSQVRFATKEATALEGGTPSGALGDYAPRLTFSTNCESPYMLQEPANQTAASGNTATFSLTVGGSFPTYQWQLSTDSGTSWNNIALNGTSASHTTPTTTINDNGNKYRCVASVACDSSSITSAVATLTVTTTAIWVGPSSGGEWNTGANWNLGAPPLGLNTNALIGVSTNVNYNLPMTASSFGTLALKGILNVNTSGFNSGAVTLTNNASRLFVNNGGVLNVTGGLGLFSNSVVSMSAGSSVTLSGTMTFGGSVAATAFGIFTNNGGALTTAGVAMNPNNASIATSCRLVINGGTNNLGAVTIQRSPGGNSAPPTLGTDGLIISNGWVNSTSISLGNNAHGIIYLVGGTMTNSGAFTVKNSTTTRPARFYQTGGLFVNPSPLPAILNPSGSAEVVYSVTGGTNMVGGFQFGNLGNTNTGGIHFTNAATIYVGSGGIATNGAFNALGFTAITNNVQLNGGGRFGASADWTNNSIITLNGGAFDTQDAAGTPHNIYSSGVFRGSGSFPLNKNGGGTLTLGAVNTYLGSTFINQGVLALDAAGAIATSGMIVVGPNAVFDVSAVSGGYVQAAGKTLGGWGIVTGAVAVAATGILDPGTNAATGTLSFSNSLTQTGGAKTHFDLSTNPAGPNNDLIVIQADFNVSGLSNLVEISGGGPAGSVHPLFKYFGNFNGDLSSFTIVGPNGVLTNNTSAKMIAFIPVTTVRTPTNIVWVGNAGLNDWDVLNLTNWLNNGVLDYFVSGDQVRFQAAGAANPNVNIPVAVAPGSITVDAAVDYVFAGAGSIGGAGSLTKTNTGRLTILNTNQFTGGLNLKGGTLGVESLADDGVESPIGKTGNLLIDGGTLEYSGPNYTWTRAVNLGTNGQDGISVSNAATALTLAGTFGGAGALTKTGNGTLVLNAINGYTGGTILNAGTLTINNVSGAGSGTITLNAGNLVIGAVSPANTIDVPASGAISGGNAGGATGIRKVTGSAPLGLSVTAGVFDLAGDMSTYGGTITFTNVGGAVVRLNGSIGSPLATWDLGAGPMDLNVRTSSSSNNIGALKGASGTTLSGRGGASNNGPTTHYIGANGLNTLFDGIIQNGAGGGSSTTSINKVGGGTLTLSGASTYTGATTISLGTLALTGSASIANSATLNITSGTTLDVSTLSTPTLAIGASQTLQGRGTILGGVDATGGLRIAPGDGVGGSVGTLTATNAIVLGGTTWMKLNRGSSPNSDKLVSSLSTITYGGILLVTNLGAGLQVGDTFDLFDGSSLNAATFTTMQLPSYYTWDTSQLGVNGTVSVTAVLPPPSFSHVDFSTLAGGTLLLNAINGTPSGPVTVLTTTNLALPLSSWTTVTATTFDGSGNLNLPVTVNPALPQSYYLLKVQ